MDLNRLRHRLVVANVVVVLQGGAREQRTLARVVVLVHQVVSRSKRHQVCVVGGGGDGDGARAANISVAQLVSQHLQLVRREVVVVPQHVVMRRTRRSLGVKCTVMVDKG